MNIISNSTINFKSIIIRDGGLSHIRKNDGDEAVKLVDEVKTKYQRFNWDLILDKNGYSLRSPSTCKKYYGPFNLKRQYKTNKSNGAKNKLIISTGENNKINFSIEFPSREIVFDAYKRIKNASGIKKMLMIFELLEQQYLLQKNNRKLKTALKKLL